MADHKMQELERMSRTLGNRIRQLCKKRGLSQEDLAILTGLQRSHVALIQRGEMPPRVSTLRKIAGALKLTFSELMKGVDVVADSGRYKARWLSGARQSADWMSPDGRAYRRTLTSILITKQDPKIVLKKLADRIRYLRFQRQWSQEELCRKSGLSRSMVSAGERGKLDFGLKTVLKLAKAFQMSLSQLMEGIDDPADFR